MGHLVIRTGSSGLNARDSEKPEAGCEVHDLILSLSLLRERYEMWWTKTSIA